MTAVTRPAGSGDVDSVTAAAADPLDSSVLARLRRRSVGMFIWAWAAIWLLYLVNPVRDAWAQHELWQRILGIASAIVFSAVYLTSFLRLRLRMRRTGHGYPAAFAWGLVGTLVVLVLPLVAAVGESGLGALVYVGVMAVFTLPTRTAAGIVAVLVGFLLAASRIVPGWADESGLAVQLFISAVAVYGVMHLVQRNAQLAAAREEIARLAVSDERNRFARDLHDLLGHSLTVVAVKAELAARLVRLSPERAEAELLDIQRLTREALQDVRAAVGGYREVSLGTELVRARGALDAARIEPDVPLSLDDVPADRQELFGWVVREGITNVIRHSGARRCRIEVHEDRLEIGDDGRGPSAVPDSPAGHGLAGLRERAAADGATLVVGRSPWGGFLLRVVWRAAALPSSTP